MPFQSVQAAPSDGAEATALRRPPVPLALHVLAAAWIAGMLLLGRTRPGAYEALLQEDRWVEWWTVALFATAGVLALRTAWRERRAFDGLVGAFCVFVAGEEFSWGQRLLGFTPPEAFLEHNRQQELTLHNFADVFGQPKWVLTAALLGFALVVPAATLSRRGRALLGRIGATAPRPAAAAWMVAAAGLLVWYPLTLTGEWVEALAGGLFLATFAPGAAASGAWAGAGALLAALLTVVSGWGRGATSAELACADAEVTAIVRDLAYGAASTGRLAGARSVHKRVYTAIEEGYVRREGLKGFWNAPCNAEGVSARREHAVDPWGTAYWLRLERSNDAIRLVVYSFGPNRRRDGPPGRGDGDDVVARVDITLTEDQGS